MNMLNRITGEVITTYAAAGSVTPGSSSVIDSTINGNLIVDGLEVVVYDDATLRQQIANLQATSGTTLAKTIVTSAVNTKANEIIKQTVNGRERILDGNPNYERKKIMVVGSSTAAGTGASSYANSWVSLFKTAMEARGYEFYASAKPGETTGQFIGRFYTDVVPEAPDFLIISYTLLNEGLLNNGGGAAYDVFGKNIFRIIKMCRQQNIIPILINGLANMTWTNTEYRWTKNLNKVLDEMGVFVLDFLGPVDDFSGKYLPGTFFDSFHANDLGHAAYLKAIPLSMFDGLIEWNDKIEPSKKGSVRMGTVASARPIEAVFADPIDTFTVAFQMRQVGADQQVAYCGFGQGQSRLRTPSPGAIAYTSSTGIDIISFVFPSIDKQWHHYAVSYSSLANQVRFYVDGAFVGQTAETITFNAFILGGKYDGAAGAKDVEFKDLLIYRTRLNDEQIRDLASGYYSKMGLELYSPLADEDLSAGERLLNMAPTASYLLVNEAAFTPVRTDVTVSDVVARNVQFEGGGRLFMESGSLKYMSEAGVVTVVVGGVDTLAPIVTASPNGGTFFATQTVTLAANETATIYYTLNGTEPTTASTVYSGPITITATTTLKFFGQDTALNTGAVRTLTFTQDTTAPVDVTSLAVDTITPNAVSIRFTASVSSDTAAYQAHLGGAFVASFTGNTYQYTGLSPSTAYTLTVKARDQAGNVSTGSSISVTTSATVQDTTPPPVPANLTASPGAGIVALNWGAVQASDLNGYRIYRDNASIGNTTQTTFTDTGRTNGVAYSYQVASFDITGNESARSNVVTATPQAAPNDPGAGTWQRLLTIVPSTGSVVEWKGSYFTVKQNISLTAVGHAQTAATAIAWQVWSCVTGAGGTALNQLLASGTTGAVRDAAGYLFGTLAAPVALTAGGEYCILFDSSAGYGYSMAAAGSADYLNDAFINTDYRLWFKGIGRVPANGLTLINNAGTYDMRIKYTV